MARSLVPILAIRETLAPLTNEPIMSERLIWLFKYLKHQNLSTSDDFISGSGKNFLVPFLATKEELVPLASDPIMSERLILLFKYL